MIVDFEPSFRDRSVFVTGHTGFKGSWLCMWLSRLGARVTGYALAPPTTPSLFEICDVPELLAAHHEGDVRDPDALHAALVAAQPEIVLHLAAESVVRRSYRTPRETFETNVMGTVNLLEAVRRYDRPCVVVCVTSDKCYENREQVWGYREDDPMGEHDPYGASKGAAELAIRSYRQSFFQPAASGHAGSGHTGPEPSRVKLGSGRAGNVLGGGDFTPDALLVDAVQALSRGQSVRLRNPAALRPWQHVLQALSGYLTLAAGLDRSEDASLQSGFNFGPLPGNELPVREVIELFIDSWGSGHWIDASDRSQPHESTILRLAIDKAIWQLGWRPGWDIRQTLEMTAQWYRAYFRGEEEMRELSFRQIDQYTQSMARATPASTAAPRRAVRDADGQPATASPLSSSVEVGR